MKKLFIFLITFYQKRISPHKGFVCAHRYLHKGDSCSEFSKKEIQDKGVFSSFSNIRRRIKECSDASKTVRKRKLHYQRGDCDAILICCSGADVVSPCFDEEDEKECLKCFDIFKPDKKERKRFFIIMFIGLFIILLLLAPIFLLFKFFGVF